MLKLMTKMDVEINIDYFYDIAMTPSKTSYPLYCDGLKTKNDFINAFYKSLDDRKAESYLFYNDGKLDGVISFFYEAEDKYLQTDMFYINSNPKLAIKELMELLESKFKGFEFYFGIPSENENVKTELQSLNFEVIEESYNDCILFSNYQVKNSNENVRTIAEDNYSDFDLLHKNVDMYWNSQRIRDILDDWTIFGYYQDNKLLGAIYARWHSEIFGIDFIDNKFNEEVYLALLTEVLNDCKNNGVKSMVFFNEEESQSSALKAGFYCAGIYICFRKII